MLLHVFVKFAFFQSKLSWSLAKILMLEAFVVELEFTLFSFLSSQQFTTIVLSPYFGKIVRVNF